MFGFFLCEGPVRNFEEAKAADTARFGKLHRAMLERGVYLAPSAFEAGFTSLAHSDDDIDATIAAFRDVLRGGGLSATEARHPSGRGDDVSPATPSPAGRRCRRSDERRRGILRLASLLLAGIGAIAWLGRSADPASRPLAAGAPQPRGGASPSPATPTSTARINAIGLALAERWAQPDAAAGRAVRAWIEDGASR
jgi:hypothetical protein